MTASTEPELRRRRRAVARAHHPDLGGDPASFILAWQGLESDATGLGGDHTVPAPPRAGAGTAGPEVTFVRRPRGCARWFAWLPPHRHRRFPTRRMR